MRNDYYSNSGEEDNYTKLTNYTVVTDDLKDEPIGKPNEELTVRVKSSTH